VGFVLVHVGVQAVLEHVVSEEDTAAFMGTSDVAVLSTPKVVALCEEATVKALAHELSPGQTSVGSRVELTHLAPVAVGSVVRATATLEKTEGRRLIFGVSVNDACGLVAAGKVTRVVVDRSHFAAKAR
jgi:fluoroacetyl-CoA thioesterase